MGSDSSDILLTYNGPLERVKTGCICDSDSAGHTGTHGSDEEPRHYCPLIRLWLGGMKFAKELEDDLVPEWKEKYLDYKQAKKKLKAVGRALRNADQSPTASRPKQETPIVNSLRDAPVYSYLNRGRPEAHGADLAPTRSRSEVGGEGDRTPRASAQPVPINERSPLFPKQNNDEAQGRGMTRYGSIIGSPPGEEESPAMSDLQRQASLLELPDPALDPQSSKDGQARDPQQGQRASTSIHSGSPQATRLPPPPRTQTHEPPSGQSMDRPTSNTSSKLHAPRYQSLFKPKRVNSMPGDARPFVSRMFPISGQGSPRAQRHTNTNTEVELEAYRELDFRQAEFFIFLDRQLEKIEDFYKQKEQESIERLKVLREQLHVMRNRRLEEVMEAEHHKLRNFSQNNGYNGNGGLVSKIESGFQRLESASQPNGGRRSTIAPYVDSAVSRIDSALGKVRNGHVGKTSKAMGSLGTPHLAAERGTHDRSDYTRRPASREVPYRVAKRKLKLALAEYYRGLELLKSYALLNRTAFRKITKKYDKTVTARPSGRYMTEKVNKAYFVNSEILDGQLTATEDLYARYFERGSHKIAVSKLRAKIARAGDYTGSVWRQGVLATAGLVFGFEGLVYGVQQLMQDDDPVMSSHASYLLQIYAGYFLMLLLAGFFVLDARAFTRAKVNYGFIFELDSRHMLDWRQLSEMPALFLFLLGFTMWCNFQQFGGMPMYTYWPVFLIGLSAAALLLPAPYFYNRTRKWFLYSNWRLLLAGLYPVEFRDFFLGDMFCSQTYALGNIELFFCLYARDWNEPAMCNSSHSRLLGFFSCLPGIWRLLQCLRRYYDTRNVFPHLVNGGKYTFTILQYMSLSLFRVQKTHSLLAFFIFSATVNSIYCSIWDVVMDWSEYFPSRATAAVDKLTIVFRLGCSWRQTSLLTTHARIQEHLVVLLRHAHRPNPALQLDLLRHLRLRNSTLELGVVPRRLLRGDQKRHLGAFQSRE